MKKEECQSIIIISFFYLTPHIALILSILVILGFSRITKFFDIANIVFPLVCYGFIWSEDLIFFYSIAINNYFFL